MQKRHKTFVAINLPEGIKKFLANYQKRWPDLPARWVRPDNLHITLSFLGYLTDVEVGNVCMVAKSVAESHNSFEINLNKISYGPIDKKVPRMVWLSGEKSKELSALKRDLENQLSESIRFKPEVRTFRPHITLAKVKTLEWRTIDPEERPEINENVDFKISVESIEVMESVLKKSGPEYLIIESHQLK